MKRTLLVGVMLIAMAPLGACLQKDTTTTLYVRDNGSIEWAVIDQNVRSDESDAGKHAAEEQEYLSSVIGGTDSLTTGFRTLGGTSVQSTVIRDRAPFTTLRSATFKDLNQVWERVFEACQIQHQLKLTTDGTTTTWTMTLQVDPQNEAPANCDSKAIEDVLSASTEHLRIVLESGSFVSASGFRLSSSDVAELEEIKDEAIKTNNGYLAFALTWKK